MVNIGGVKGRSPDENALQGSLKNFIKFTKSSKIIITYINII